MEMKASMQPLRAGCVEDFPVNPDYRQASVYLPHGSLVLNML